MQCNANHDDRSIDGLIDAFARLTEAMDLSHRGAIRATDAVSGCRGRDDDLKDKDRT